MRSASDRPMQKGAAILVSQYFPPFNSVASQRAMRMAVTLLHKFDIVYVVTLPTHELPDEFLDLEFGKELVNDPRLQMVTVSPILTGYGFTNKTKFSHRFIGALLTRTLCSSGIDWISSLKDALLYIIAKADVKLVVTTGGPFVPFYIVTKLARKNNIPSIIDYRDLWSQNPRAPYPRLARFLVRHTLEKYVNKRATMITTVSEGCAKSIFEVQSMARVEILPNYPDKSYKENYSNPTLYPVSSEFNQNVLNIVLAGSVYRECTCRVLVQAIQLMPKEWRGQIKLHYYGSTSKIVKHDFQNQGMLDNLIDHGFVNKSEAINAVKKADLLLSLVFGRSKTKQAPVYGTMTTKVFDYFLSGKPIINIGPPGGDLNLFAKRIGYIEYHSFESIEIDRLAEFLLNALHDLTNFRKRNVRVEMPDFSESFEAILRNVKQ